MEKENSPLGQAPGPHPSVERGVRILLIISACVAAYFLLTNNALLGTWSASAEVDSFQKKSEVPATTTKGIKFFRSRRFTTFGMDFGGRPASSYGTYHFGKSNLVSLDIKGFRLMLTNRLIDVPIKGPAMLMMEPQMWHLSDDGKSLEEVNYSGDGRALTLYRE